MEIELLKFQKKYITKEYISWLNDKRLMQFSEQRYKIHTFSSCKKYLKQANTNKDLFYAIIEKSYKKHVGNIYIKKDKLNMIADIRILIGKPNKGYGYLAWINAIKILKKIKIRKITAGTISINKPMLSIFNNV